MVPVSVLPSPSRCLVAHSTHFVVMGGKVVISVAPHTVREFHVTEKYQDEISVKNSLITEAVGAKVLSVITKGWAEHRRRMGLEPAPKSKPKPKPKPPVTSQMAASSAFLPGVQIATGSNRTTLPARPPPAVANVTVKMEVDEEALLSQAPLVPGVKMEEPEDIDLSTFSNWTATPYDQQQNPLSSPSRGVKSEESSSRPSPELRRIGDVAGLDFTEVRQVEKICRGFRKGAVPVKPQFFSYEEKENGKTCEYLKRWL